MVAAWLALHLVLTSVPERALPSLGVAIRVDWLAHFGLGVVLGTLVAWALRGAGGIRLVAAWLAIAAFAALDEWHQPYFGRSAEVMDWIMGVTGGLVGLTLGTLVARRRLAGPER